MPLAILSKDTQNYDSVYAYFCLIYRERIYTYVKITDSLKMRNNWQNMTAINQYILIKIPTTHFLVRLFFSCNILFIAITTLWQEQNRVMMIL